MKKLLLFLLLVLSCSAASVTVSSRVPVLWKIRVSPYVDELLVLTSGNAHTMPLASTQVRLEETLEVIVTAINPVNGEEISDNTFCGNLQDDEHLVCYYADWLDNNWIQHARYRVPADSWAGASFRDGLTAFFSGVTLLVIWELGMWFFVLIRRGSREATD